MLLHTAPELSFYEILIKARNIKYVPGDKMVDGYSNQEGILNIGNTIKVMAAAEGLQAHKNAVTVRLNDLQ